MASTNAQHMSSTLKCCMCAKSLQSFPTLCNSMDCGLPDSSVHGILQARILEWLAMPFSRIFFFFLLQDLKSIYINASPSRRPSNAPHQPNLLCIVIHIWNSLLNKIQRVNFISIPEQRSCKLHDSTHKIPKEYYLK